MKKNILLAMILASCGLFVACNGAGGQGSGETASKPMESTREQTEESVTASGTGTNRARDRRGILCYGNGRGSRTRRRDHCVQGV